MVFGLGVAVMCASRARLSIISLRIRKSATVCMHALQRRLQRARRGKLPGMARDKILAREAREARARLTERVSVRGCADVIRRASCKTGL